MRQVRAICARAGVELWARLWQTLRASCEKQWAMTFPQYAVSKWIGHSITVSGRHYANDVPDELFQQAAALAAGDALQNPVQKPHETTRNNAKRTTTTGGADDRNSLECESLRESSANLALGSKRRHEESNPQGSPRNRPSRPLAPLSPFDQGHKRTAGRPRGHQRTRNSGELRTIVRTSIAPYTQPTVPQRICQSPNCPSSHFRDECQPGQLDFVSKRRPDLRVPYPTSRERAQILAVAGLVGKDKARQTRGSSPTPLGGHGSHDWQAT
jgi:hypothetical protein